MCEYFLEQGGLTKENVIDVLQLARNCDAPRLSLICVRMVVKDFKAITSTEGWKIMKRANPALEQELVESVVDEDSVRQFLFLFWSNLYWFFDDANDIALRYVESIMMTAKCLPVCVCVLKFWFLYWIVVIVVFILILVLISAPKMFALAPMHLLSMINVEYNTTPYSLLLNLITIVFFPVKNSII